MTEQRSWSDIVAANPDHSRWYVERFRSMAAAGRDLDGEGRMIDAILTHTVLPRISVEYLQRLAEGRTLARIRLEVADGDFAYAFD